jgi:glucosamine-6-phosphate deaminase
MTLGPALAWRRIMLVVITDSYDALSRRAAGLVANALRRRPALVLGLATGSTPLGLYLELVRLHREEGLDFSRATTFNLDEYLGLGPDHPCSYHRYMKEHLFDHVNLDPSHTHVPDGRVTSDFESYCATYEAAIRTAGGIDLQVLGLGADGHIGFNEPTSSLASRTRVKTLTERTLADNRRFFPSGETLPECAITVGIGTILEARQIVLLATGEAKAGAAARAIEGPVTSSCSASALQMHPCVTAFLDEEAAARLAHRDYYRRVMETTERLTPERLG